MFASYMAWDAANPHFWPMFERFTLELAGRGYRQLSAKLIFERIRWESMIQTRGEEWKLNNNYTAFYARRYMQAHPEHGQMFSTRVQHAIYITEAMTPLNPTGTAD